MTTYRILRSVPFESRAFTANSLKNVFIETGDAVDIILKEISQFDEKSIADNILISAKELFDKAVITTRLKPGNIKVIECPKVEEVPSSIYMFESKHVKFSDNSKVHVERVYTLSDDNTYQCPSHYIITFGLILYKNGKCIITALYIHDDGHQKKKIFYRGLKTIDSSIADISYPPNGYIKKSTISGPFSCRKYENFFEYGQITYYPYWLAIDFLETWCNEIIHLSFSKNDMNTFLSQVYKN